VGLGLATSAIAAPEYINATPMTAQSYPISEAVKVGTTYYLSGKLGTAGGKLVEGGIQPEAKQAMENIQDWLVKHGLSTANIVKCTIFLADSKELPLFNEVYKTYFPNFNFPSRSAVGVSGLALNARVEVECIASAEK
jgi:reactive intermediate/imine deaminase